MAVAAATFVVTSMDSVRKTLAWRDQVTILSLESRLGTAASKVTVANTGDGEIIGDSITIMTNAGNGFHQSQAIGLSTQVAPKKTFSEVKVGNERSDYKPENYLYKKNFGTCDIAFRAIQKKPKCGQVVVFSTNNAALMSIDRMTTLAGESLCQLPAEGTARFFSIEKNRYFEQELSLVATGTWKFNDPQCQNDG